jgi:MFS family permease
MLKDKKNDPYASLRYREFRLFLLIRFALVFAWSMQFIIIEWEVYRITKDPLSLGLIGLIEIIPAFSMALFAGHFVDQKEKRNLLFVCTLGFLILSIGFWQITSDYSVENFTSNTILLLMYCLVFLGGIVRSFISPTIFALMSLVVPRKLYPNASAWSSSVWQLSAVVGPACGGFTINYLGVHHSLSIVIVFILTALLLTVFIKRKAILNPKIGEKITDSLREGIKFVFGTKIILGALTLDMIAVLFGGAIALLPIFAMDILKVGPEGFGIMRAAPAVGSFITMFAVAYFPVNKKAGFKLFASIFVFGVSIIVFGLSTIFWLSVFALFISGVSDGISMVIRSTILQLYTPDNMRGRVASVTNMFVGSSNELGAFESGVTAKIMGTVTAVVFGGVMTLITVSVTAIVSPSLRGLDFESVIKEEEEEEDLSEHLREL